MPEEVYSRRPSAILATLTFSYQLSNSIRLEWIPDADHSLKSPQKSGHTEKQNLAHAVAAATSFILALP